MRTIQHSTTTQPYFQLIPFTASNIIYAQWAIPMQIPDAEWRESVLLFLQAIRSQQPQSLLIDLRNSNFVIRPSLQTWLAEQIGLVCRELGISQVAVLKSHHFVAQVSLEQTLRAQTSRSTKVKMFDEAAIAHQWLSQA
ncbi:MAG TPA: hypothetical protein DCM08_11110 [Microscillaceae bacterium]|jgi:hypothetical protein|nr:hypothetical protein [Microscillaceae bacterium]